MGSANSEIITSILSTEEGQNFECKRASKKPADVLHTICAFANTDGGTFVYGLEDPKKASGTNRLRGITEASDNCGELLKLIACNFIPPLPDIVSRYVEIVNTNKKNDQLLIIIVPTSKNVHSLHSGQTYIRRGSQNNILTHEQAMQLHYEKGSTSFESELADISIEDLDKQNIEKFMHFNKSQDKNLLKFLANNGLAEKRDGNFRLNNAAALLFATNPFIALKRKCGITISHFLGMHNNPSAKPNFRRSPFTIEGALLSQIIEAYKYLSENALPIKLEGPTFKRLRIPDFVIQEAITNAVIHRDYSIQNNIHIRIFDDRIEIESPGWFAGFVTPETILNDRFARNPIIERTLKKMPDPPNLDIGEGVNRMFSEMKKNNLYQPLYSPRKSTPHSVCVVLFNEEKVSYWDIVSKYVEEKNLITNREFRDISGLETLKASELLKKWTKQGLLEKIGDSKKKTAYGKPSSKKSEIAGLLGSLF
ncbi:MAG: RNA-binding domain-containing protein [Sedimentisphaerales bacterium]